jgi:hypothetical protein
MSDAKSTHIPEMSGAEGVAVTGSLIVDTGLRTLQTAMVALMGTLTAGAGDGNHITWSKETLVPGQTQKIKIEVWDATHAAAATNAVNVSWLALGK